MDKTYDCELLLPLALPPDLPPVILVELGGFGVLMLDLGSKRVRKLM